LLYFSFKTRKILSPQGFDQSKKVSFPSPAVNLILLPFFLVPTFSQVPDSHSSSEEHSG